MGNRNQKIFVFIAFTILSVFAHNHTLGQVNFSEKEVSFESDSVVLSGTLMIPKTQDLSPAVVFLHGSGPMTREGFRPYAEEFAKLGFASISYDKRGTGLSDGSWLSASLDNLAEDALAAIKYLKKEKSIDPKQIGFWGVSQAGWIAPLAASQAKDIAFMILVSGGGVSPRESEVFSYRKEFEKDGLTESEKSEAFKVLDIYFNFLATGDGRSKLLTALDEIRENRLKSFAEQLDRIIPSDENRHNWSWVSTYKPAPDIEKLKCPVLLMFGDLDTNHPTELAVDRWRKSLKKAGNDKVTLMIFPGAGHGIRMREGYSGKGRPPFADGYKAVQLGWLWKYIIESK